MKKWAIFLSAVLFVIIAPLQSFALTTKIYNREINVSVNLSNNFDAVVNSVYELYSNETGQSVYIPANTTLNIQHDGTGVIVSYPINSYKSKSGFYLREVTGSGQGGILNKDATVHQGATTSYPVVKEVKKGDAVIYHAEFVNAMGEKWYNVTYDGTKGWMIASSADLSTIQTTPLTKIKTLQYRGSFLLKANGTQVQVLNYLDMEDYLRGVVPSEMPASWHMEALKAQAIAARSYAANSMSLSNSAVSQVYRGFTAENSRTNDAINATAGIHVKYNGKPIQAFFHSTSGGRTANVGDVWNSNQSYYPYLVSVESPYENSSHSNWTTTFDSGTILTNFGYNSVTDTLLDIKANPKGANGEIGSITITTSTGTKTVSGNESEIRKMFPSTNTAQYNVLRSNWFTMTKTAGLSSLEVQTPTGKEAITTVNGMSVMTSAGQTTIDGEVSIQTSSGLIQGGETGVTSVTLNGKGWGHRIGLSQYGAKGYAERGWTAEQILKHFYRGTTVEK